VILKPVLNAALVKVVFKIARQRYDALLDLELAETDAALVLVGETFRAPLETEHFGQHLRCFALLSSQTLVSLDALVKEVRDEAGEKNGAQNEHDCGESSDDQGYVVNQLHHVHGLFATD